MLNINDNTLLVNNEIIKIKTKKNKINKYGFDCSLEVFSYIGKIWF